MGNLIVNIRDQQFVLFEQLGLEKLLQEEPFLYFTKSDLLMIMGEAEKLAVNVIAPTLKESDRMGCKFQDGKVTVPDCFHEPFKKYCAGGWLNPMDDPEVGGQGIPFGVGFALTELFGAANYSFAMYPGLTHGAAGLLHSFGTEEQKRRYMDKLYAGEWTGTMCLTEPGAGSDVGALKTAAKKMPDGNYLISGTKCFISSGDHNLTPNIIHMVLARIEGDVPGTRGISIFIVPKYRVRDDGAAGEENDIATGGIEHKMGIKGSATATLNFGENGNCIGELLGREREGLKIMFQMMNEARLGTGMQGLALASAAYEHAVSYARERIQGTAVHEGKNPEAKPVTIINHPDIRRKLLWMKAHVEGMRSLCYFTACSFDRARVARSEEEKRQWEGLLDLLTPIVKAYCSDKGMLICSAAIDVYGGYGYCSEYPVEQYLRDEKIATIYEGTNGIQALDLVGRKLGQNKGANVMHMTGLIKNKIDQLKSSPDLKNAAALLEEALKALLETMNFFTAAGKNGDFILPVLNASKFLEIFGDVLVGYLLLDAAEIAGEKLKVVSAASSLEQKVLFRENKEAAFYSGRIASVKFFAADVLATVRARCESIKLADKSPLEMSEEAFAY